MSHRRTVIVDEVSYRGTDDEDHVAHRGDKIVVSASGIDHFDTFQALSPEGRWAEYLKQNAEAEKAVEKAAEKAAPAKPTEPEKS